MSVSNEAGETTGGVVLVIQGKGVLFKIVGYYLGYSMLIWVGSITCTKIPCTHHITNPHFMYMHH